MRFVKFVRCLITLLILTGTFSMTAFAASTVGEWGKRRVYCNSNR